MNDQIEKEVVEVIAGLPAIYAPNKNISFNLKGVSSEGDLHFKTAEDLKKDIEAIDSKLKEGNLLFYRLEVNSDKTLDSAKLKEIYGEISNILKTHTNGKKGAACIGVGIVNKLFTSVSPQKKSGNTEKAIIDTLSTTKEENNEKIINKEHLKKQENEINALINQNISLYEQKQKEISEIVASDTKKAFSTAIYCLVLAGITGILMAAGGAGLILTFVFLAPVSLPLFAAATLVLLPPAVIVSFCALMLPSWSDSADIKRAAKCAQEKKWDDAHPSNVKKWTILITLALFFSFGIFLSAAGLFFFPPAIPLGIVLLLAAGGALAAGIYYVKLEENSNKQSASKKKIMDIIKNGKDNETLLNILEHTAIVDNVIDTDKNIEAVNEVIKNEKEKVENNRRKILSRLVTLGSSLFVGLLFGIITFAFVGGFIALLPTGFGSVLALTLGGMFLGGVVTLAVTTLFTIVKWKKLDENQQLAKDALQPNSQNTTPTPQETKNTALSTFLGTVGVVLKVVTHPGFLSTMILICAVAVPMFITLPIVALIVGAAPALPVVIGVALGGVALGLLIGGAALGLTLLENYVMESYIEDAKRINIKIDEARNENISKLKEGVTPHIEASVTSQIALLGKKITKQEANKESPAKKIVNFLSSFLPFFVTKVPTTTKKSNEKHPDITIPFGKF